jgi:hypothetical protein
MAGEIEGTGIPFTDIHINLTDQTITLKKEDEVVATLVFEGKLPAAGVIFFGSQPQGLLDSPFDDEPETPVSLTSSTSASDAAKEREKTVTLSGKLTSQPKPGKVDRSGKPTAYADFAAHVEGEKGAHDYVATFHRHTRQIALKLPKDAQITVNGYPHPNNSPSARIPFLLSTSSIIQGSRQPNPRGASFFLFPKQGQRVQGKAAVFSSACHA